MRVAVAGASGFLGRKLVDDLRGDGHAVLTIGRGGSRPPPDVVWDPARQHVDAHALEGTEVVVNLAGANIGQRWTAAHKHDILASRVDSTALLARVLGDRTPPPRLFVSASAVGYYGYQSDRESDETAPRGRGFLADVVERWEAAAEPARQAGVPVLYPRFGLVMSPRGGALERMLPPFKLGAGGKIASGKQWMSWIALTDWSRALRFLIDRAATGIVNVTSPSPVQNDTFAHTLGHVLHRPSLATVPAIALKLAFGAEMAEETLLGGQRAVPKRLVAEGFRFELPGLEQALSVELGNQGGARD